MFGIPFRLVPVPVLAVLGLLVHPSVVAGQQVAVTRERVRRMLGDPRVVEFVGSGRRVTTLSDVSAVTLRPGGVLVPVMDTVGPVRPAPDSVVGMGPGESAHSHLLEFITLDTDHRPRRLAVTAEPQGGGLRHDGQHFRGTVYLGIEDPDNPGEEVSFSPVALQVFAHADRINPERIQVHRTTIPSEQIALEAASPGTYVSLYIWVAGQQGRTEYQVPVLRSRLRIESSTRAPQGLGLDEAEVTVTVPEEVRADSVRVRLSANGIRVPPILTLRPGIPESFTIRTKGVGVDTIRVAGPGYLEAGFVGLDLRFPLSFLLAALTGGLAGAIGSRFWRKRRHKTAGSLSAELLAGLAGGLVVAVLYTLGVNVTALPVSGPPVEAVVFVIAGVGAMFGLPALVKVGGASARAQ